MDAVRVRGIDEWSQVCSDSFVPLRAHGSTDFRGRIRHLQLGGVGVSHVASTRSVVSRTPTLIAREPRDDVLLSLHLAGSGVVEQHDRSARLGRGTGAVYEAGRPNDLRFEESFSELVLQVPRTELGLTDASIRDVAARPITGTVGMVVLQHLLTGVLEAPDPTEATGTTDPVAADLGATAVDVLASTLRALGSDRGARSPAASGEALFLAARLRLRQHLSDPRTSIESVARREGMSRRYLELLFARHGETSPASYLRGLRLHRARTLLEQSDTTVTSIAYDSGFNDVNTFIRAFRRQHGQTPEEWRRGRPRRDPTPGAAGSPAPRT